MLTLDMKIPSFCELIEEPHGGSRSYAMHMHPDPHYYMYRWWVFWRGSPCDGREFLSDTYSLCTADAMALLGQLASENEGYWIYNKALPRNEPGTTPFDRTSAKWLGKTFAPPLDQDPNPEWRGHR